ncbi:MAG: argininosuccinate lyase [Candidatus Omnitrophica bacterium]|jgi:argininosuccinate lyase|nr:argininosuccinate lyase [Candidatus Omnitrophota bacterium]
MAYIWEGRLKELSDSAKKFTFSINIDNKLAIYDIKGSIVHVKMLDQTGIISKNESKQIEKGLKKILNEFEKNIFQFKEEDEDIHSAIERRLIEIIGKTGEKIHTSRSRNDQIVLDEKLYLKDFILQMLDRIKNLQNTILKKSEEYINTYMTEFTHFQPSQPVLLSHHLLCYVSMLERDKDRLKNCLDNINISPLGAGSGVGTSFNIDPLFSSRQLGFKKTFDNSVDAVSDRDFILETISDCGILMIHLSRLAEELIIWSCPLIDFVILPDEFCTGSSIMPQKKNPDVLELIRGKTSSVIGNISGIFSLIKGLPLSYNRDFQEDKKFLFETIEISISSLNVLKELMEEIIFNTQIMENACKKGYIIATDIAENLVKQGVPFRTAHHLTGQIVAYAIKNKKEIKDLDEKELKSIVPQIDINFIKNLNPEKSIELKISPGGTGKQQVKKQILKWKQILK